MGRKHKGRDPHANIRMAARDFIRASAADERTVQAARGRLRMQMREAGIDPEAVDEPQMSMALAAAVRAMRRL